MKRGTPGHPKTLDLLTRLRLEPWGGVGVLEHLWHFAQGYAPRGDVGKHTNQVIANGIGWRGDPEVLIRELLGARWLDRCRCHRLRIHDWPDHADQTTKRKDEVVKLGFLECYGDPSALLAPDEQNAIQPCRAVPTPTPAPGQARPAPEPATASSPPAIPPPTLFDGPRKNPLVTDRVGLESECLRLVREEADATGRDGAEVMAERSGWKDTRKVNPAAMTDDRLLNTVLDLRKAKATRLGAAAGKPGEARYERMKQESEAAFESEREGRAPGARGGTRETRPDPAGGPAGRDGARADPEPGQDASGSRSPPAPPDEPGAG